MLAHRRVVAPATVALPASVDLTPFLPPPGDQGQQGSCVGWAIAYSAKTFDEVNEEVDVWDQTSTRYQFSPSWIYNQINGGTNGPVPITRGLNLVVSKGADTLRFFPYSVADFTTTPNSASMTRASRFKAAGWGTLPNQVEAFKQVLAGGQTIIVGFNVTADFDTLSSANDTYDDSTGVVRGGHAVVITGYDDARSAFSLQNSWGAQWGIQGRGWLAYSFINDAKLGLQAYVLDDDTNEAPAVNDNLYAVDGRFIYRVDDDFGDSDITSRSGDDWTGATSIASLGDHIYVIQNSRLHLVSPVDGGYSTLGGAWWGGPTHMVALAGNLYVIQNDQLYRVSTINGTFAQVGNTSWAGASSMTTRDGYLYIIQNSRLHRVNPTSGAYVVRGQPVWAGPTHMASRGASLYVVHGNILYSVDPTTGARTQLGTGSWDNVRGLTVVNSKLFAIQGGFLTQVDTVTGGKDRLGNSIWWGATTKFTGHSPVQP